MLNIVFPSFPILTTVRLILRPLEMRDEPEIYALRTNAVVNKYLIRPMAKTHDEVVEFIRKIQERVANHETFYWAISFKDDPKLIGTVLIFNIVEQELKAEIGYELLPPFWGKGIMQEAFSKAIEFGFHTVGLKTLEANVDPGNSRSSGILERNNFKRRDALNNNTDKPGADIVYYLVHDEAGQV